MPAVHRRRSGPAALSLAVGSHPQMVEIQRRRILSAAVRAVDELGYPDTSVAHITSRARVSRRTFYELFTDCDACLEVALEDAVSLIERELRGANLEGLGWRERVRLGLWLILSFFDREPVLARVCVVQALRGGPAILRRREQLLQRLALVLDEGGPRDGPREGESSLTAEGLVGAGFSIVYTRLLREDPRPLTGLWGELMGLIVLPYLGSAAAKRERAREVPSSWLEAPAECDFPAHQLEGDPMQGVPIRMTYRTTRVLECVAAHPGVNNRQLADRAGITDQGQASKLFARLERAGLLANTVKHRLKGEANAWRLTPTGTRVADSLSLRLLSGGRTEQADVDSFSRGLGPSLSKKGREHS